MEIKDFEEVMKNDIKNIFEQILTIHNYILPISSRSRSGAEISDYLEDYFVKLLADNDHPRIYNADSAPKGKTKNPFDFRFYYKYDNDNFHFDDVIWGDIKASKFSYNDSNPDLGTPTKVIRFMLDGHFYLMFVFFEYVSTDDNKTKFIQFDNNEYVKVVFLKDIHHSVRINPKPQFQVNIHEPEEYRTKEEFLDLFLQKYKESNNRIIKKATKKNEELDSIFDKIKEIQLMKKQ